MVVEIVAMVEVTFVSAGAREDDPASTLLLTTFDPLRGTPGKEVVSGGAPAVGACCGAGGGGRFGACLQMDKNLYELKG